VAAEGKKRVLVVEDQIEVQNLIRVLLERFNFETIEAYSVNDAVQILRKTPLPDIVLLDLMLPDVSGLELLRQMRAKEYFDNLPVIILSAIVDPDQIRDALATGADRYVTKPNLAHSLVRTVQETLRTGRRKTT
jgi:CheY-like chemotaxis protein